MTVLLKNIDVLITRDFLKVNAPTIRYICVIDFFLPIDPEHASTKVTLLDERLEVNVFKDTTSESHNPLWDSI